LAAAFLADQVQVAILADKPADGREVHRRVFPNRGMRAAAGFDAANALLRQRFAADQELGVFSRVNVVRHDGDVVALAHALTERIDERRLPRSDRTADAEPQYISLGHVRAFK